MPQEHMQLAEELLISCYQMYAQQPTFLAPEITYFNIQVSRQTQIERPSVMEYLHE
jgi:mannosyl-oligosaccharide alpha-1,2-mannosidase